MRVVLIGYGPSSVAAAIALRAFDSDAYTTILTREDRPAHRRPGVALALGSPETNELDIADASFESLEEKGIQIITKATVISGDPKSNTLTYLDSSGQKSEIEYDYLVIGTGGTPTIPMIPGNDLKGVHTIQTIEDTITVGKELEDITDVVIIGAGFSGLEMAEKFHKLGKHTHMVVRSRLMRRQLEESMSNELLHRIPRGLHVHCGVSPKAILGEDCVKAVQVDGDEIPADLVLFMTGVRPNVTLAKNLGVKIGSLGGIVVDEQMRTSIDNIFAVGDCIEMLDNLTGKPILMPIGSTAARSGRQAGIAIAGSKKIYSDVALRLQYDRLFNTDVVCVGHSSVTAENLGLKTNVLLHQDSHEHTHVALVTDGDGYLIGGQVISSRLGAQIGYQILERIQERAKLDESPLLDSRHKQLQELMDHILGPIQ
ncbi:MAG: Coenzyme A disulfide reductase [Candidatus Thorarchaeota archaeon]|nr:MAG: Coenzyme A disulfide reductase [Candidatus Thorarchaeota archaeon]